MASLFALVVGKQELIKTYNKQKERLKIKKSAYQAADDSDADNVMDLYDEYQALKKVVLEMEAQIAEMNESGGGSSSSGGGGKGGGGDGGDGGAHWANDGKSKITEPVVVVPPVSFSTMTKDQLRTAIIDGFIARAIELELPLSDEDVAVFGPWVNQDGLFEEAFGDPPVEEKFNEFMEMVKGFTKESYDELFLAEKKRTRPFASLLARIETGSGFGGDCKDVLDAMKEGQSSAVVVEQGMEAVALMIQKRSTDPENSRHDTNGKNKKLFGVTLNAIPLLLEMMREHKGSEEIARFSLLAFLNFTCCHSAGGTSSSFRGRACGVGHVLARGEGEVVLA